MPEKAVCAESTLVVNRYELNIVKNVHDNSISVVREDRCGWKSAVDGDGPRKK